MAPAKALPSTVQLSSVLATTKFALKKSLQKAFIYKTRDLNVSHPYFCVWSLLVSQEARIEPTCGLVPSYQGLFQYLNKDQVGDFQMLPTSNQKWHCLIS